MTSVNDKFNRQWMLNINFAAIRAVKTETGCDLGELIKAGADGKLDTAVLDQIRRHTPSLMDVLWALCKEQATSPPAGHVALSRPQFESAIFDAGVWAAFEAAFWKELVYFFRVVNRLPIAVLIEASRKLAIEANTMADGSGSSLTNSPPSPESPSLTGSPSANS